MANKPGTNNSPDEPYPYGDKFWYGYVAIGMITVAMALSFLNLMIIVILYAYLSGVHKDHLHNEVKSLPVFGVPALALILSVACFVIWFILYMYVTLPYPYDWSIPVAIIVVCVLAAMVMVPVCECAALCTIAMVGAPPPPHCPSHAHHTTCSARAFCLPPQVPAPL